MYTPIRSISYISSRDFAELVSNRSFNDKNEFVTHMSMARRGLPPRF
jgi:hypothetical protein